MQRRLLIPFGILAALAGIGILIAMLLQPPPEIDIEITMEQPDTAPAPTQKLPGAERQSGTLKGSVVNGVTNKAIAGATVIPLRPYLEIGKDDDVPLWGQMQEVRRVRTDGQGRFSLEDLPPDYWNLWVEKKGYAWTTVPRAKFKEDHLIKLYPGCSIWGKVVYEDNEPAEGVRIEYTPQGTHSEVFGRYRLKSYYTTTKDDGTFLYDDLPPGMFTIEAYPKNHLPAPWTAEPPLGPGENRRLKVHKLNRGFGMTVHVKWRGTDEPVEGIEVVVRPVGDPMPRTKTGQTRTTDINGIARFSGLGGQVNEEPSFTVAANVPGVGPVVPDVAGLVTPNSEVTIYLRRDGLIRGTVLGPDGTPLPRFHVSLKPIDFIMRQRYVFGDKGAFEIHQVPEGDYRVIIRHGNLVQKEVRATAVAGSEVDIGTITLSDGAEIYGTVRNANGTALEGVVRVELVREVIDPRTNRGVYQAVKRGYCRKDGTYALRGVPEGRFLIQAMPEVVVEINKPVPIEVPRASGGIQRDLVLYTAGYVDFRFLDLVNGSVRQVVSPPIQLVESGTGEARSWTGSGTPFKPGTYSIAVELKQEDGSLKRYENVQEISIPEMSIQDRVSLVPIEIRLFEIRNGG